MLNVHEMVLFIQKIQLSFLSYISYSILDGVTIVLNFDYSPQDGVSYENLLQRHLAAVKRNFGVSIDGAKSSFLSGHAIN